MLTLFIMLITSHFLGDFVFQSDKMVLEKKTGIKGLLKHSAIITLITLIITLSINPLLYMAVFVLHLAIDKFKTWKLGEDIKSLLIDQTAHIIAAALIAVVFDEFAHCLLPGRLPYYPQMLMIICGLTLCVSVGCVVVEKFTKRFVEEIDSPQSKGLTNGGRIIGKLERALIFFLIIFGQPAAIGFLFAAKSILRFGEIKEPGQRKEAEYIIIGTFASFGWAIVIAFTTKLLLESQQF